MNLGDIVIIEVHGAAVCGLVRSITKRMAAGEEIEQAEVEYLDGQGNAQLVRTSETDLIEIKTYNYDDQAEFVRRVAGYESAKERASEMTEKPAPKPVAVLPKAKDGDIPF